MEHPHPHVQLLTTRTAQILYKSLPTIILLIAWRALTAFPQTSANTPTGDEILARVDAGYAGIEDYTVSLEVTVNLDRVKVPQMHATMYFKKPDKVHFDAENFAMLPREGVAFNVKRLLARYRVEQVGHYADTSFAGFILTLEPKSERVRMRHLLLYIRPERWTVERFTAALPDGRTMEASFSYEGVDHHWLPSDLTVIFSSAERDSADTMSADQLSPGRRPVIPQKGTITIRYSDYRVNTGLSDDIFDTK
jgi:hypothetical protein